MIAFDVYVNAEKVCTAGVGELAVVTSILTWRSSESQTAASSLKLDVGGLTKRGGDAVRWTGRSIRVGDEIRIRVVEATAVDLPHKW